MMYVKHCFMVLLIEPLPVYVACYIRVHDSTSRSRQCQTVVTKKLCAYPVQTLYDCQLHSLDMVIPKKCDVLIQLSSNFVCLLVT